MGPNDHIPPYPSPWAYLPTDLPTPTQLHPPSAQFWPPALPEPPMHQPSSAGTGAFSPHTPKPALQLVLAWEPYHWLRGASWHLRICTNDVTSTQQHYIDATGSLGLHPKLPRQPKTSFHSAHTNLRWYLFQKHSRRFWMRNGAIPYNMSIAHVLTKCILSLKRCCSSLRFHWLTAISSTVVFPSEGKGGPKDSCVKKVDSSLKRNFETPLSSIQGLSHQFYYVPHRFLWDREVGN